VRFRGEDSLVVVFAKQNEIQKVYNLSSPGMLTRRSDTAREHKIELLRFPDIVAGIWILDRMLSA